MGKVKSVALLLMLAAAVVPVSAQNDQGAPPELVEYVRKAQAAGIQKAKIRQDALAAGWPAEVVDQAIASAAPPTAEPAARVKSPQPTADTTARATAPNPTPADPKPASLPTLAPVTPTNSTPAVLKAAPPETVPAKDRGVPEGYQIGAGDVLQISVWKEPDVSVPSVVVRPDGKIAMPLIKEVDVVGMTPTEVEKVVTERLDKFITGVDVTVIVTKIESKKIYLSGAVKKEGPIPYTYRMSVMQALNEAGGLSDYAKRKKIYILRNEGGKEYRLPFDYQEVIKGEKLEQNIELLPGDVVVVPQ
jgi:polysaccharide biosynthesis/export protein